LYPEPHNYLHSGFEFQPTREAVLRTNAVEEFRELGDKRQADLELPEEYHRIKKPSGWR
jgi:hypothetical protein